MKTLRERINELVPDTNGREISLADVLLAIERNNKIEHITTDFTISVVGYKYRIAELLDMWNLTKNLEGQSEETKTFIYNLLV